MAERRAFGSLRKLPSRRWQARYCGPDGAVHTAPHTFSFKTDADAWLAQQRADITRGTWQSPAEVKAVQEARERARVSFGDYSRHWLEHRDLRPRTRQLYDRILVRDLLPSFAETPLSDVTPGMVRAWWHELPPDRRTGNSHAYALLRTIMGTAVEEERVGTNPCRIRGAGAPSKKRHVKPATLDELAAIAEHMPDRWRLLVWLGAACALRIGEATELRRRDLDLSHPELAVVRIRRAVTYRAGRTVVGSPKTEAGSRDVTLPPNLRGMLVDHLDQWAQPGADGLLFSGVRPAAGSCGCGHAGCKGGHLAATALYPHWDAARRAAGRPDLRLHDLRHTGAVMAAQEGATVAELMGRLGHTTPAMALRYQHVAEGRDAELARRMAARWTG